MNVRWCGPAPVRATKRVEEVVALGVPRLEQLDLHAAAEVADEHLHRTEPERLPARQHGAAEHAGEEAHRRRRVGRGERDVIEIGVDAHVGAHAVAGARRVGMRRRCRHAS